MTNGPLISHLATFLFGGAGIAATRIHTSLLDSGLDSRFFFFAGDPPDGTYTSFPGSAGQGLRGRLTSLPGQLLMSAWNLANARLRGAGSTPFSPPVIGVQTSPQALPVSTDIIHLHWVALSLNLPYFLDAVGPATPVVWTLHDMNPLTGGCHYAGDCEAYTGTCQRCPQQRLRPPPDVARYNQRVKLEALSRVNLHVVANSSWLEGEARRSAVLRSARSIRTIHYGVDTDLFSPTPTGEAKERLGVDPSTICILFGAFANNERRKGLHELVAAFGALKNRDILLLTFGEGLPLPIPLPSRHLGTIRDPQRLALLYAAADIFVIPSLQEAFGQTAMEAISCGTPVIGFQVGGIPDIVRPHQTGLLVPVGDIAGLATAIDWMIDNPSDRSKMGASAREYAVRMFSKELQAEAYTKLYSSALDSRKLNE